jgi:glucose-6-phosphate isomerase
VSDLLDDVVAAAGLTVFGAAPAGGEAHATPGPPGHEPPGPDFAARIETLRARGLDRVVLCATGAPAAAARAVAATLGLPLTVLDTADPHRARVALGDRPERTVVVLAAHSGPTAEMDAYRRAYLQAFDDAGLHDVGRRFVVVTAPGSALVTMARETGAELFLSAAPPSSALSEFGLVAAGLAGADTSALLAEAAALLAPAPPPRAAAGFALAAPAPAPAAPEPAAARSPGVALGATIAAAVREGRDKLAVAPDGTGIDGLGEWIERLFPPGVVPVLLENPSAWGHQGPDVLSVTIGGALGRGLMPGGGIAPDLSVNGPLGAQLLAWQQAAAVLGAAAPDPEDDERLLRVLETGPPPQAPSVVEGAIQVYGTTSATTLIGAIDELARSVPAGGHLAIAAHLDRDGDAAAGSLRDALAGRVARAVTFGWGSRPVLPGLGAYLQITGAVRADLRVPDRPFTFGELQAARAAADRLALPGRPLLRLHLTDRATGIDQLLAALGG